MTLLQPLAAWLMRFDEKIENSRLLSVYCPGCRRHRILGGTKNQFHYIPNADCNGGFGSRTFVYCEECNERLSLAEKKMLAWNLILRGREGGEQSATEGLKRGEMLCAQIDKGL